MMAYKADDRPTPEEVLRHPWLAPLAPPPSPPPSATAPAAPHPDHTPTSEGGAVPEGVPGGGAEFREGGSTGTIPA